MSGEERGKTRQWHDYSEKGGQALSCCSWFAGEESHAQKKSIRREPIPPQKELFYAQQTGNDDGKTLQRISLRRLLCNGDRGKGGGFGKKLSST